LKVTRNIQKPLVLVFSPSGKLVSFSHNAEEFGLQGETFHSLFEGGEHLFESLSCETGTLPDSIIFSPAEEHLAFVPHVLKDPTGTVLAVIMTLFPDLNQKEETPVLDERMIRMDRLAQVGQLAASLAHEIRNPLAGISANVQVLTSLFEKNDSNQKIFSIILEEVERVEKIMKDLLGYARQARPLMEPLSLPSLFEQVNSLISAQLSKQNIRLILKSGASLRRILADGGQLTQVFLNLILNAANAMPRGGEINVEIEEMESEVKIVFRDNGVGMEPSTLAKIFDPFFTTKTKGLGLGLTIAKKIIEDHHGRIEASSCLEKGTRITLFFPFLSE
jgi:signal transduction histidine kinase